MNRLEVTSALVGIRSAGRNITSREGDTTVQAGIGRSITAR